MPVIVEIVVAIDAAGEWSAFAGGGLFVAAKANGAMTTRARDTIRTKGAIRFMKWNVARDASGKSANINARTRNIPPPFASIRAHISMLLRFPVSAAELNLAGPRGPAQVSRPRHSTVRL